MADSLFVFFEELVVEDVGLRFAVWGHCAA